MADNDPRPSSSLSSKKPKIDRRIVERNRRIEMNNLCSQLVSLIPPQPHFNPSQKRISQADQIEHATNYIMESKQRIEQLKKRKEELETMTMISEEERRPNNDQVVILDDDPEIMQVDDTRLPIIRISDYGNEIQLQLVTSLQRSIKLGEVIRVLEEEGAEVENFDSSYTQGNKVYHTLKAKAQNSRVGIGNARVQQRLQELVRLD